MKVYESVDRLLTFGMSDLMGSGTDVEVLGIRKLCIIEKHHVVR